MEILNKYRVEIPTSGAKIIKTSNLLINRLVLHGDPTLESDVSIQLDEDVEIRGFCIDIEWDSPSINLNENQFTILGVSMTEKQLSVNSLFRFEYNIDKDEWFLYEARNNKGGISEPSFTIEDESISTAKIASKAVTLDKMDSLAVQSIIVGVGGKLPPTPLSIENNKFLMGGDGILKAVQISGDILIPSTGVAKIQVKPVEGLYRRISLNSGYLGSVKMIIPFACTLRKITAHVDQLIEATDDATVQVKNNSDNVMGSLTIDAGSTIGTGFTLETGENNVFAAGEVITFQTSKTTPGGEVYLSLEVSRTNFNSYGV